MGTQPTPKPAMTKHLERDMEAIYRDVLSLSAAVEEVIDQAAQALCEGRMDLARRVVSGDEVIDRQEVRIEEECLKVLALHQPVAVDLRRIVAVLKANNDLERIADLAVNIAERAEALWEAEPFPIPARLPEMVELATRMLHGALDAFVNLDPTSARKVCLMDDEVDRLNREVIADLAQLIERQPRQVRAALQCFSASRHVERIADHATNIAEDVLYLVEGEIVRHRVEGRMGAEPPPA